MPKLDDLDEQIKGYGGSTGSDRFEFKQGANQMRILNFPAILATHFIGGKGGTAVICVGIDEGCIYHGEGAPKDDKTGNEKAPSLKLITYIIDRVDGKVKLAELPLSVRYALKDLQNDLDFAFEDFPMPYDVRITWDPDNKDPKAKYRLVGGRTSTPLTEDEQVQFDESMNRMTPEQYVDKRKGKQKGGAVSSDAAEDTRSAPTDEYPEGPNPEDIPF